MPRPAYSSGSHQAQDTTPLGLRRLTVHCPGVAAKPQHQAEDRNPGGIPNPIRGGFPGVAAKPQHRAEGWNPGGIPNRQRFALPQRGNVLQPRVAAQPLLPWDRRNAIPRRSTNPNGVVSRIASESIIKAKQLANIVRAEMEGGK